MKGFFCTKEWSFLIVQSRIVAKFVFSLKNIFSACSQRYTGSKKGKALGSIQVKSKATNDDDASVVLVTIRSMLPTIIMIQ